MKLTSPLPPQENSRRLNVIPSFQRSLHGFHWFLETRQFAALFTDHWEKGKGCYFLFIWKSQALSRRESGAWTIEIQTRQTSREQKHNQTTEGQEGNGWSVNACEGKENEHSRGKAVGSKFTTLLQLKHISTDWSLHLS